VENQTVILADEGGDGVGMHGEPSPEEARHVVFV
jgi:hypothetical protein